MRHHHCDLSDEEDLAPQTSLTADEDELIFAACGRTSLASHIMCTIWITPHANTHKHTPMLNTHTAIVAHSIIENQNYECHGYPAALLACFAAPMCSETDKRHACENI